MSELAAQLALYGAIDSALAREQISLERAGAVVGGYRLEHPRAPVAGWYPIFVELFGVDAPGDPTLGPTDLGRAALAEVAGSALDDPPEIAAVHGARRIRALHAYAQTLGIDGVADEFLGAVGGLGEIGEPSSRDDLELVNLLLEAETIETVLTRAEESGRLDHRLIAGAAVPCQEELRLVEITDGPGPVMIDAASITLRVEVPVTLPRDAATIERIRHAVHPSQWPNRLPWFWRAMVRRDGRRLIGDELDGYDEAFAYEEFMGDFKPPSHADWYHPTLRFITSKDGNDFELFYDLDRQLNTEPKVLHDAGFLRIEVLPDRMTATMDKEVALDRRLPSAAAAIITCASGATDLLRSMATGAIGPLP